MKKEIVGMRAPCLAHVTAGRHSEGSLLSETQKGFIYPL